MKKTDASSTDSAAKKVRLAIKELDRLLLAYGKCPPSRGPEGCEVCSARHAPLLGIQSVLKVLRAK